MKKFLLKLLFFFSIILLIFIIGLIMPVTPRASKSLLFAKKDKDSLLVNVPSPRIIFVGGSGLSFGLNSQIIKDSLGLNPINTGIHATIGLTYMLDHTLPYIQPGDIVVVAPEYSQFYGKNAYGGEELFRTIMDVSPNDLLRLRYEQWMNIYGFFPKYSFSKFSPKEYLDTIEHKVYSFSSFNKFGDAVDHWNLGKEKFWPFGDIEEKFNQSIIKDMLYFEKTIQKKGAIFLVTYPGYQDLSFENGPKHIKRIELEFKKNNFTILGSPERYKIPDSMMFNSPYHLSKVGSDYRTYLLIADLKNTLKIVHLETFIK